MAWTAIVARPSCAKELYFCLYGHSPLSPHFVRRFTPESAFADSLERFSDSRSIIVKTALRSLPIARPFPVSIVRPLQSRRVFLPTRGKIPEPSPDPDSLRLSRPRRHGLRNTARLANRNLGTMLRVCP